MTLAEGRSVFCHSHSQLAISPGCFESQPEHSHIPDYSCTRPAGWRGEESEPGEFSAVSVSRFQSPEVGRGHPCPSAGDVDGDDGRAHLEQLGEGAHRRARADHDDVHAREALASVKVVGGPAERVGRVGLDDAARSPVDRPRLERLAGEHALCGRRVWLGGVPPPTAPCTRWDLGRLRP